MSAPPGPSSEAVDRLEGRWFVTPRYRRRARVLHVTPVTSTRTVRVGFEAIDGQPFAHEPGQFVGMEAEVGGLGYRRSPYCILSPPRSEPIFELLVRMVDEGPLSLFLGAAEPGTVVAFRGPTGRSMVPADPDVDLVLMATGVGVAPLHCLANVLLGRGFSRRISLWWGLRLADDVCLTPELDALAEKYPNFRYQISLSQPPEGWDGLCGRVTESVPPLLDKVGGTRYYLVGNGRMLEEMALALSAVGVSDNDIYREAYFNGSHDADPRVVTAIKNRFAANDLEPVQTTGNPARPGSVSDLFDHMPDLLSGDQDS